MVQRNSPAFKPGGMAWMSSVVQAQPSKVASSKLPIGSGLWFAPPCPNRAQGLSGRWFCIMALSYCRGHSCSHRAKTMSYQHPESQPDTFFRIDVSSVLPKCNNLSSALPQVWCLSLTANGMCWWGPTHSHWVSLSLDPVSLRWRP